MSLDRAIQHGKEHRRPYPPRSMRNIDRTCRNHGSCTWCEGNRLHLRRRQEEQARDELGNWEHDSRDRSADPESRPDARAGLGAS